MSDEPGTTHGPPSPGGAVPPEPFSARAGRAVRRLARQIRTFGGAAGEALGPTVRTVRQDLIDAFGHLRRSRHRGPIVVGGALLFYGLSGTYVVSPGEMAVVTRFGRMVQERVTPGLRWHVPWPVESARTVNVAQVRREGIGITFPGHPAALHPPEDIQLLTGDENLLAAQAIVQYRVREPADYLFRVSYNEDPLLRAVIKAAVTEIAGGMQVDTLLTAGRTELQQRARERVQRTLDAYRSGLEIVSIDFQAIAPPGDVLEAFRDVASAREEKSKLINDAQGYANSVIPQARGEAERRLRDAEGYRTDVVNRARGEAERFATVLAQYKRDAKTFGPEVSRYRLYVETMERTLPKAKKYIVEPGRNGEGVNLRILEPLPVAPPPANRP